MTRRRDQRGLALSVWTAAAMPGLIITVGLGVDFSGHAAAEQEARAVAAQAARAATHEVRVTAAGAALDAPAARRAAVAFLRDAGYDGSATVMADRAVVSAHGSYRTLFLGLIGIAAIPVEVTGSARAVATVDGSEA